VPVFSACSHALDGVSWVRSGLVEIAVVDALANATESAPAAAAGSGGHPTSLFNHRQPNRDHRVLPRNQPPQASNGGRSMERGAAPPRTRARMQSINGERMSARWPATTCRRSPAAILIANARAQPLAADNQIAHQCNLADGQSGRFKAEGADVRPTYLTGAMETIAMKDLFRAAIAIAAAAAQWRSSLSKELNIYPSAATVATLFTPCRSPRKKPCRWAIGLDPGRQDRKQQMLR
jgi:hypothetical protein